MPAESFPVPTLRPARDGDVEATYRVMLAAAADLNRKLGRADATREHSPPERALAVRRAALRHDPDRFWVAEVCDEVVGFGIAIERGTHLYLAALHVLPRYQGVGLGAKLLAHCLATPQGDHAHTVTRLTISEAANVGSTGLYMRLGLAPTLPILQLAGRPVEADMAGPLALERLAPGNTAELLRRFDRSVLGLERDADHATWSGVSTLAAYLMRQVNEPCGYIYVDETGSLGPAAALTPELLAAAIELGLDKLARTGATTAHLRLSSAARPALASLTRLGFRLEVGVNLLLSDRPIGDLDRYLFSGADALF